jgi:hypothetical protein
LPQGRLANFIDNIVIPGPLIHGIVQRAVNEEWLGHLEDLHNKLEFVRQSKLVQVRPARCLPCPDAQATLPVLFKVRGDSPIFGRAQPAQGNLKWCCLPERNGIVAAQLLVS